MSTPPPPRLIIVSGLSGSGKSVALHALEDFGFFCVDNLPSALLPPFLDTLRENPGAYGQVAIGIDARSREPDLNRLPGLLDKHHDGPDARVLFLHASDETLIRRFSETRRRHPLAEAGALPEAIEAERHLLKPLAERAEWTIDTSDTNIHQLRRQVWKCVGGSENDRIRSVVVESFAFKRGVPADIDLLFDARCLPNPHWDPDLHAYTGLEPPVVAFLDTSDRVRSFYADISGFVKTWLPRYAENQRSYLTIGIGCTGGRHRSVYLAERLANELKQADYQAVVHHRELER